MNLDWVEPTAPTTEEAKKAAEVKDRGYFEHRSEVVPVGHMPLVKTYTKPDGKLGYSYKVELEKGKTYKWCSCGHS